MRVINIFGSAGVGKSTAASGLFYEMKKMGLNVELVTEYAKSIVWEKRYNVLDDQIYVFAKQQRSIRRLLDHGIEYVITDSPIPLGLCYVKDGSLSEHFFHLVMEVFNQYDNYNYLLSRNVVYNPIGRMQTESESKEFDKKVIHLLRTYNIPYDEIVGGEPAVNTILTKMGFKI
jgi:hypothetical protein